MENLELAKNLATIAAPITKELIASWLTPKLNYLSKKWNKQGKLQNHFFDNKFNDYLLERYKSYSVLNILAFRNQQRLLKDIYLPLTLALESSAAKEIEFCVTEYDKEFISTYQRILIIDTAGMGKSTISKKLFLSAIENNSGIPVFIELRRLKRNRSIIEEIYNELKLV
ncbi:hypothetical protein GCM10011506_48120 [Marivirga lumbricoides]|uniref:NACHT domain-containing protein n=1 Tax=Marivirga lumbricoides TaxID=1046115 RepID=A0ABQ1NAI3_9BACT|nr:hypothetical protein GCM10011506_48120 [Marivirga lumbricoides]